MKPRSGDPVRLLRNGVEYAGVVKYLHNGLLVCELQWGNGARWQEALPVEALNGPAGVK